LGGERPDLLVVELTMAREQQQKTLQALENFNSRGRPISMVLLTNEKDLMSAAVSSIQLVKGPLSEAWLHAYLTGVSATCRV
jgi:phage terminase Nu1 subunit (DNA packaging protein)